MIAKTSLLALIAGLTVAVPLTGAVTPDLPAQDALFLTLRFDLSDGRIVWQALGSPTPSYRVYGEPGHDHLHVDVLDADGSTLVMRAIHEIPADTPYVALLMAPPKLEEFLMDATGASSGENHAGTCDSNNWFCADLDADPSIFGTRMWHGLQVNANAPYGTDPSKIYYKMPCNTHAGCISGVWAGYAHTQGSTYGSLHCYKHVRSSNNAMTVYSSSHMGGVAVTSANTWTLNTNSRDC